MTVFYVLLWHIGLLAAPMQNEIFFLVLFYLLAAVRFFFAFCRKTAGSSATLLLAGGFSVIFPFALMGLMGGNAVFQYRKCAAWLFFCWLAVLLSFGFYLPVVLWSNRQPKVGDADASKNLLLSLAAGYVPVPVRRKEGTGKACFPQATRIKKA